MGINTVYACIERCQVIEHSTPETDRELQNRGESLTIVRMTSKVILLAAPGPTTPWDRNVHLGALRTHTENAELIFEVKVERCLSSQQCIHSFNTAPHVV